MGFFGTKARTNSSIIIFDIGSASIGGALVRLHEASDAKPEILSSVRAEIAIDQTLSFDRFVAQMEKTLALVSHTLMKSGTGNPDNIYFFLSSPWFASQTRVVTLKKNIPFHVTEKVIRELSKKEIDTFIATELPAFGGKESARIIEYKTIAVALNGYTVADPVGKRAKEIQLSLFLSMGVESMLTTMEAIVKKDYPHATCAFSTFLFSSFAVTRDLYPDEESFLILDVGGEVTDVSIVKKDTLMASVSFPSGRNTLLRRIVASTGKTIPEALSYLILYQEKRLSPTESLKIERILHEGKEEWLRLFQGALIDVANDLAIPSRLYITIDTDVAPWFSSLIQEEEFGQYLLTEKKFSSILLGAEAFRPFVETKDAEPDPFIMIESIALNRHLR